MKSRWKPSVTVAAVIEHDGRFLLVEEETSDGLKLNNPAGHLEPGESLVDACVREALEETTHAFRPTGLLGIYMSRFVRHDEEVTYLRIAFRGELGPVQPGRRLDAGIVRTLWMPPADIRATADRHRSPLLLRCIEDYLAGVWHPLSAIHTDASVIDLPVDEAKPPRGSCGS